MTMSAALTSLGEAVIRIGQKETTPAPTGPGRAPIVGLRPLEPGEAARVVGIRSKPAPTRVIAPDSPEGRAVLEKAASHLTTLGIGMADVALHSMTRDPLGMVHVRLNRKIQGLPVYGEQTIIHLRPDRISVSGSRGQIAVEPAGTLITAERAAEVAMEAAGREGKTEVQACYFKNGDTGRYVRGFAVQITGQTPDGSRFVVTAFVNGSTAKVQEHYVHIQGVWLPREIDVHPVEGAGSEDPVTEPPVPGRPTAAGANDRSLYSGPVELDTTRAGDVYVLLSKGGSYETRDAQNTMGETTVPINDANDKWGEESDSPLYRSAVDAHYVAQTTSDAYYNILGIDSIDLQGKRLLSKVRIMKDFVNAFWDGAGMNYGEGDGRTSSPLTTLDIGGHEITHGLTNFTAGLIYRGESGGLNEAMSDVGGVLVEWYAAQKNPAVKWNWTIGEKCWTPTNGDPNDGLRYMDNPTKDGYSVDHYSKYPEQTEVHGSSGIANNAFYQLAETDDRTKKANSVSGIAVQGGIGMEKAAKIFFRALIHYMTPRTSFAEARHACIEAAMDLYGAKSVEVAKVKEAWSAVGVEENNTLEATHRLA